MRPKPFPTGRLLQAVDLFCGGGGTSRGLAEACEKAGVKVDLLAINHWAVAVETHTRNHPWARHLCSDIEAVNPRAAVPGGRVHILVASPECTDHSTARGGRPVNDQRRATAWCVLKWCQELYIENVLIENVPEFENWGPIGADGRPLKTKRGETFRAYLAALESLGYSLDYRMLNSADYGAATTRTRLFIIARRGRREIRWPKPTHAKVAAGRLKPWRAAREIIDWQIQGRSIFGRDKPLAKSTLERIEAGIRRFCGGLAEPFLVALRNHTAARRVSQPLPTITAKGNQIGLAEPFLVPFYGERKGQEPRSHSVERPVPTLPASNKFALVNPFLVVIQNNNLPKSLEKPVPSITAGGKKIGLAEPFLVQLRKGSKPRSSKESLATITTQGNIALVRPFIVTPGGADLRKGRSAEDPLATVTGSDRFAIVEPFILPQNKSNKARSGKSPIPTLTTTSRGVGVVEPFILGPRLFKHNYVDSVGRPLRSIRASTDNWAMVEPFIAEVNHGGGKGRRTQDLDGPLKTVTATNGFGVVEPCIAQYNTSGSGKIPRSVRDPIATVTAKDRFALVEPLVTELPAGAYLVDIHFRMLQTHELASAMGFPKSYEFKGKKADCVRQIGNAVEVNMARALMRELLAS